MVESRADEGCQSKLSNEAVGRSQNNEPEDAKMCFRLMLTSEHNMFSMGLFYKCTLSPYMYLFNPKH